jgi:4-amino-4-deoxychorismate lyase
VEYTPYLPKKIQRLQIVSADIDYNYKYADRKILETLLKRYPSADDVLIEKKGYLTDTTIANIAFYDGTTWLTPKIPLLEGTVRARLLNEKLLTTADIKKEDIGSFTHVALMNAMIGFKILNHITIG